MAQEYVARIARLEAEVAHPAGMSLTELAIRFALSHPAVSTLTLSMQEPAHVGPNLAAAARGPLPAELVERITREHVWVKNFYYYTKAPPKH